MTINRILLKLNDYGKENGFPYVLFALFQILNYLLEYPGWMLSTKSEAYPFTSFHLVSLSMCILLALKKYWPKKLEKFYTLYWYIVITWCLPASATFFYLHHTAYSSLLLLNAIIVLFTLILIVDWISVIVVLSLGILIGLTMEYLAVGDIYLAKNELINIVTNFCWAIFVGVLFSRNASRYRLNLQLQKQLTAVRTVCASIAHELRTPLLSIKSGANGIKLFIPKLLTGYKAAVTANLPVPQIFPSQITHIEQVIDNLESEVNFSNTVIDTLLLNATQIAVNPQVYTVNSISQCIRAALLRYPFNPSEQLELVHFDSAHDFIYHGDDLLITHVLFNLLKNALYAIAETQKGEIYIWLSHGEKYNYLHFKDTAKGLTKVEEDRVFEPFQSNTPVGTGIGLSFCKMVMQNLGGDIGLQTKTGDYAEFILEFPKVESVPPERSTN